ncbi:MAG TPA: hypothetical protein VM656_16520 [Pyrinomonadaceae bacterium]|nr:hypothetical protein [Pyrinomonadaceae bacterium]
MRKELSEHAKTFELDTPQRESIDEDLISINRYLEQKIVADELIRRATQLSAAQITFIEDDTALKNVGGVGALLRYRISAENAAPYEQGQTVSRAEALIETDNTKEGGKNVGEGSTKERSQAKGQGE